MTYYVFFVHFSREQWGTLCMQFFTPYRNNNKLTMFIKCTFKNKTEQLIWYWPLKIMSGTRKNQYYTRIMGENGAMNDPRKKRAPWEICKKNGSHVTALYGISPYIDIPVYYQCFIQYYTCLTEYRPWHEKTCLRWFESNTGTDQPVHPPNLISAFVISFLESVIC